MNVDLQLKFTKKDLELIAHDLEVGKLNKDNIELWLNHVICNRIAEIDSMSAPPIPYDVVPSELIESYSNLLKLNYKLMEELKLEEKDVLIRSKEALQEILESLNKCMAEIIEGADI